MSTILRNILTYLLPFISILVHCSMFRVECCIKQLWCSSIILCDINSKAHNHHTHNNPPSSKHKTHNFSFPHTIYFHILIFILYLYYTIQGKLTHSSEVTFVCLNQNTASPQDRLLAFSDSNRDVFISNLAVPTGKGVSNIPYVVFILLCCLGYGLHDDAI